MEQFDPDHLDCEIRKQAEITERERFALQKYTSQSAFNQFRGFLDEYANFQIRNISLFIRML